MIYSVGFLVSAITGVLAAKRLAPRLQGPLLLLLGAALGFGIDGTAVFYLRLCLGIDHPLAPFAAVVLLMGFLAWVSRKNYSAMRQDLSFKDAWPGLALLAAIIFFLWCEAAYYPLGGWDAWSCWNLKARFIYLGHDRWKDMFDPLLWRSNTHYPLLLPCINAWSWNLAGGAYPSVPMLNSVLFSSITAGLMLFTLKQSVKTWGLPLAATAAVFLLPFNVTLSAGQYSDILCGLFLLCAFVCFLQEEYVLCGAFTGLLAFTKTEGMVAAVIFAILILLRLKHRRDFLIALSVAALPAVIFQLCMAPKNEAFINGLLSAAKPSTWERLCTIGMYFPAELLSGKWNGLWIIAAAGLAVGWKKAFGKSLNIFGMFFVLYLGVVLAYYQANTFFEIGWWLSNTLNRILFSLLPSLLLWMGLALL